MDMSTDDRIRLYQNEIERHTPPRTKHDIFMSDVFKFLLNSAKEQKQFEQNNQPATAQEAG
ncbi:MAG: hypothetical protein ABW162_02850 [Candidatus Sedimenticola sp. PURPLELP]